MSSELVEQLSCEIAEFEKLRQQAQLPNVQKAIDELIERKRVMLEQQKSADGETNAQKVPKLTSGSVAVRPIKKLTTYAFDESDKFVKLYYSVPGITNTASENISTEFHENSFSVRCSNIEGIDYEIRVQGLCQAVDPEKCVVKQKNSDQLLVMLKKVREHQNWGSLLKLEKEVGKSKIKVDKDNSDPQESLMNMMKQMYDEGDDEMKRTIRKAWHEAQNKKNVGDLDL